MSILIDAIKKTFSGVINYFQSDDSRRPVIGSKRKRSFCESNENIDPKRLRRCIQTETAFSLGTTTYNIFTTRGEKIQSMTKFGSIYPPRSSGLRAPLSWNRNNFEIEISSDEDNNDNDVQIVSEMTSTNRNTLTTKSYNSREVLQAKKGREMQQQNGQTQVLYKISRPITAAPLTSTSLNATAKKSGRSMMSSGMKRDVNKSQQLNQSKTLQMAMQEDDKAAYGALLLRFFQDSPNIPLSTSSSFSNLQDVDKKFRRLKPLKVFPTKTPRCVEFIDLTKPKERRRPIRIGVQAINLESEDSDLEVVSVKPVTRVNSFDMKTRDNKFTSPEWLQTLREEFSNKQEEINRELIEENQKKEIYAKHNLKQIQTVEERVRRHMTITDAVILDEPAEEQLPELTKAMLQNIDAALYPVPSNEVVAEGFRLSITRQDMHTLANSNWLNDEVINFYMELLIERGKRENMPNVYAFNTFFYPKLVEQGFGSLKRWTRKVDVFSYDIICVPVHLGVHWCMALIDFKNTVVEYYDSMGSTNSRCLQALCGYLNDESMDKKKVPFDTSSWKTVNMKNIPQQQNGSDCGMFACTFAEYKCRNAKFTFSQDDMKYLRKKMVYEILTCKLMIPSD